jgi:hypothetical protein
MRRRRARTPARQHERPAGEGGRAQPAAPPIQHAACPRGQGRQRSAPQPGAQLVPGGTSQLVVGSNTHTSGHARQRRGAAGGAPPGGPPHLQVGSHPEGDVVPGPHGAAALPHILLHKGQAGLAGGQARGGGRRRSGCAAIGQRRSVVLQHPAGAHILRGTRVSGAGRGSIRATHLAVLVGGRGSGGGWPRTSGPIAHRQGTDTHACAHKQARCRRTCLLATGRSSTTPRSSCGATLSNATRPGGARRTDTALSLPSRSLRTMYSTSSPTWRGGDGAGGGEGRGNVGVCPRGPIEIKA